VISVADRLRVLEINTTIGTDGAPLMNILDHTEVATKNELNQWNQTKIYIFKSGM
jgi:hypothetical protein